MSVSLPADKSLAHRALLLAALSPRPCFIERAGDAADVRATIGCLRALGARVVEDGETLHVSAPTRTPATDASALVLDAGNSGTTARLLAGWLAGRGQGATVVGDASLSRRPMARVATPVNALFSEPVVRVAPGGTLPLVVTPAPHAVTPEPLVLHTGVASAQVKSAVLLAALSRPGLLVVREPAPTRDHTERLLRALGADLLVDDGVRWRGPFVPEGSWVFPVPRDPSALALLAVAALGRRRELVAEGVAVNPTRTAFLDVLARMGVHVEVELREIRLGEHVGRVYLAPPSSSLRPVAVSAAEAPGVIDEVPALAALAALAGGESRFEGLGELRVKESDRLSGLARGLSRFGAPAHVEGDTLVVAGGARLHSAPIEAQGDHRLEMALLALAAAANLDVEVPRERFAHVSFPGFLDALRDVCRGS